MRNNGKTKELTLFDMFEYTLRTFNECGQNFSPSGDPADEFRVGFRTYKDTRYKYGVRLGKVAANNTICLGVEFTYIRPWATGDVKVYLDEGEDLVARVSINATLPDIIGILRLTPGGENAIWMINRMDNIIKKEKSLTRRH